jgi:integrase
VGDWLWDKVFQPRLDSAYEGQEWLMPTNSTLGHYTDADSGWARIRKRIGYHFSDHDLRRTFTTMASSLGSVNPFQLTHLLMHETDPTKAVSEMTLRYAKKDLELMTEALNAVQQAILTKAKVLEDTSLPAATAKLSAEEQGLLLKLVSKMRQ